MTVSVSHGQSLIHVVLWGQNFLHIIFLISYLLLNFQFVWIHPFFGDFNWACVSYSSCSFQPSYFDTISTMHLISLIIFTYSSSTSLDFTAEFLTCRMICDLYVLIRKVPDTNFCCKTHLWFLFHKFLILQFESLVECCLNDPVDT